MARTLRWTSIAFGTLLRVMFDDPKIARIIAPNLTAAVQRYSDSQLAAIIRNGVRPDGRSVVVMPAKAFLVMTDADISRIIGYLRSAWFICCYPPAFG